MIVYVLSIAIVLITMFITYSLIHISGKHSMLEEESEGFMKR